MCIDLDLSGEFCPNRSSEEMQTPPHQVAGGESLKSTFLNSSILIWPQHFSYLPVFESEDTGFKTSSHNLNSDSCLSL